MRDDAKSIETGGKPGQVDAKTRALDLARVQATDEEIKAVLRVEFEMGKVVAERRVSGWSAKGLLEDARIAGRLLPLEALRDAAAGGDVAAATALHKRQELLDGLDPELLRQIKRWMAMEPSAAAAEAAKLLAVLRAG